ncbi:MAG TPA: FtsQ-type POTRA domain-containing protein [Bacteroidota bacterium]|nr:FtsQ-type POTRA domain-containing protein [Bacteroidota bacterium]
MIFGTDPSQAGQNRRSSRRGLLILVPLAAGMVVLFLLAQQWKGTLKIQRVVVSGAHLVAEADIASWAKVPLKSQLFGLNLGTIAANLLAQPFMKSVSVYRQIPDAVHIHVEEREPLASLNNGQIFFVDRDAVLLPAIHPAAKLDVPLINGIPGMEHVQAGETASSNELFQAIELLTRAREIDTALFRMISEVNMNNGGDIICYSVDGGLPIIVGRGEFGKKLVLLHSFWTTILTEQDPKKLKSIDLRFDDQVVVRWDKTTERYPKQAPQHG